MDQYDINIKKGVRPWYIYQISSRESTSSDSDGDIGDERIERLWQIIPWFTHQVNSSNRSSSRYLHKLHFIRKSYNSNNCNNHITSSNLVTYSDLFNFVAISSKL